ncbi:MAG TPA: DUF362 domain-containing protein [Anaerolineaceae bacterium]|nr:DUF362 domain-containing protein [Anaerolineaceae bacterium]
MEQSENGVVVITHAPAMDFTHDYVSLPREYGTPAYDEREDVKAIKATVRENLEKLDAEIHFTAKIRGHRVIIKPNLVTVFHDLGMTKRDYPESTDPRVIDAVIEFLLPFTSVITIVESSGRGMPTQAAFHVAGLDRLAKYRQVRLVALEEQPIDRYLLPKARVMREIVVPRIFSEVVRGEAFYISIPKMKTNLYTGVTLGFKNAMGTLAYNMRQRNHNHAIDQKLVDMLHLYKADLVIIDGIVGGEGNCPAPVDPVQSRVIVSGNQSVETDRVATRMMGFDPESIPLMRIAAADGFNDPKVRVIGEETVTPYRPADPSLLGDWMKEHFPNVRVLIGHSKNGAPLAEDYKAFTEQELSALENACRGGCLATTRYAFDMLLHEGKKRNFELTLILGAGVKQNGSVVYFDGNGKPYTLAEIAALNGKKVAIGTCTHSLKGIVDRHVEGCMPLPNSPHMVIHQMSGTMCSVMTPRNRYLLPALVATLKACERRKALLRSGKRIDIPLHHEDKVYQTRELTEAEKVLPYVFEPFKPLTAEEIKKLTAAENRSILATFLP